MNKKLSTGIIVATIVMAGAFFIYQEFIAPPNWQANTDTAASGTDEAGRPWIGAKSPKLVIHEYLDYDCPHCSVAHKVLRSAIARKLDSVRIVRHDYARTSCGQGSGGIVRCPMVRAAYCASRKMSYWKWNDAVISAPRHESGKAAAPYIEELAAQFKLPKSDFDECIKSDESAKVAQSIYEETTAAGVNATPTYIVDGKKYNLGELIPLINKY